VNDNFPVTTALELNSATADAATGPGAGTAASGATAPRRGPLRLPDGREVIGRVGAPPRQEATSGRFFFWVPPDALVEKTQLVTCESVIAGRPFTFYAVVDEVYRASRKHNMGHEVDESDNDVSFEPPFTNEGYTWASATILRTSPAVLVAPRERSGVYLATPEDAGLAYEADEIERKLPVGLIKNGGDQVVGPGYIDLDYLLGVNGGHLNVNGSAGRGTKSSFLLFVNWLLLYEARKQARERPSDPDRLRIVPIILNVKGFDLFYLDRPNRRYSRERDAQTWKALGIATPAPFQNVAYYAAQQPGGSLSIATGRTSGVAAYSWSLSDIIERGLFIYLFAEADANDANFGALALDIESWLTNESTANDGSIIRSLRAGDQRPTTLRGLLTWVNEQSAERDENRMLRGHTTATWRKLYRRLLKLLYDSGGVLRLDDLRGNPLNVVRGDITDPLVVDLAALVAVPEMQRFVVATILRQLVTARTGTNAVRGLVYVVTLDELNRFAPRGARDPITQLVELVASEMRSQGIILFGAQQQASKVSEKVIENAAIRVLGRTGTQELTAPVWGFLGDGARSKAASLGLAEKLVNQDNFREPMYVRVPFPAWAMNRSEAGASASDQADDMSDIIDG
jgi:hypothetical protein